MNRSTVAYAARVLLAWVALTGCAAAQEKSVAPGINERFLESRNFGEFVDQFEREGREIYDRRNDIAQAVALRPGMVVADIGAGSGLFTRLFARDAGPGGRVYALEINPVMVTSIVQRLHGEGYRNVEGQVSTAKTIPVPPASLDVAFTSDVYHHFEYPQAMLQAIRTALKPGGAFIVVDFERIPGLSSQRILEHVRAGKETVIKEVEAEGFRLVEEKKLLRQNYYLKFEKPRLRRVDNHDQSIALDASVGSR